MISCVQEPEGVTKWRRRALHNGLERSEQLPPSWRLFSRNQSSHRRASLARMPRPPVKTPGMETGATCLPPCL